MTLKVRGALGLVSTATTTVTVRAPAFTGGPEQLLPVVLDTSGAGGTHYTTELTLGSKAGAPVTVLLQYTASAGSGSGYASVTLAAGELRVIPDAIEFLRTRSLAIPKDGSAQIGTLRALFQGASSSSDVFIGGRTSTPGGGGTFGLFYTAAATSTTTATVFGLQQNAAQRSNLALVNAGPDPITLRAAIQGPNGETLPSPVDQTLPGYGWTQLNQPLLGQASSGRAVITRVSGASPFSAYGVLNDAVTLGRQFRPGRGARRCDRSRPAHPDRPCGRRLPERADADQLHVAAAARHARLHGLSRTFVGGQRHRGAHPGSTANRGFNPTQWPF